MAGGGTQAAAAAPPCRCMRVSIEIIERRTTGFFAVFALALLCSSSVSTAAPSRAPSSRNVDEKPWTLMEALAGASYERRVYDKSGRLVKRQVLKVGDLVRDANDPALVAVPVAVTTYDARGAAVGTAKVEWRCDEESAAMLMTAAIYTGADRDLKIFLDMSSAPIVYPRSVVGTQKLKDIHATIKVTSGFLRLLGTRTKLSLIDRKARALESADFPDDSQPYLITSRILARIVILGIPIKRIHLQGRQWVDPQVGVIRQELSFADGSASAIARLSAQPRKVPSR